MGEGDQGGRRAEPGGRESRRQKLGAEGAPRRGRGVGGGGARGWGAPPRGWRGRGDVVQGGPIQGWKRLPGAGGTSGARVCNAAGPAGRRAANTHTQWVARLEAWRRRPRHAIKAMACRGQGLLSSRNPTVWRPTARTHAYSATLELSNSARKAK
ncbi:MAG: hypothetical protein J3K34DRAFT_420322 [Monoraphidium minutum]|nr:MAG: hypothetical protein J3K34DRAFT_420322 [Monoraphidium minutum]